MNNATTCRATSGFLGVLVLASLAIAADDTPSERENEPTQNVPAAAAEMTLQRMDELIRRVDPKAKRQANGWEFTLEDQTVAVIVDPRADRMRIMIPITPAEGLKEPLMLRLLQANFDSALDARYAVAQGILWSTFIHPLSPLTDDQFLTGLGQTVNAVLTFGTSFTSGLLFFGGGDSASIERRKLIDRLKDLGTAT